MAKFHELISVEGDLDGTAKKVMEEAITTFKKAEYFIGGHKWLEMFDDARKQEEEEFTEHKEIETTVPEELAHVSDAVSRYYDAIAQKEATNQKAVASLEIDGEILIEDAPATLLLGLESRLKNLRNVYDSIPTLAPGVEWVHHETKGKHIWKTKELEMRHKKEKSFKFQILVNATKEHPAQIEKWNIDVPIGNVKTDRWSGALSPAMKSKLLGRIDALIRAVKQARQRANTQEVEIINVGQNIFSYIHQDL